MTLKQGNDKATIQSNIKMLIDKEKYKPDQAAAIAYNNAGESKKPKSKQSTGKRAKSKR